MPSQSSPNAELGVRALHPYRHHQATKSSGRLANRPHRPRASLTRDLLSGFNPWRNQADVVHLGLMAEVDNLRDLAEVEVLVPLDEHDLLLASRKDLRQLGLEVC